MKVLGIIGEYNPFHNGHIYHINKSKEITKSEYTILIMSGNFTQNGNISILNKFERSKIAINHGIDLVIELPTIFASSSAKYFASSAISLLNKLKIVDYLCFGSEEHDINKLKYISKFILNNNDKIYEYIKSNNSNLSFAKSREIAIKKLLEKEVTNKVEIKNYIDIISKPNNILGIEYIQALLRLNSNIEPFSIYRDNTHNNICDNNSCSNITSATAIRNMLKTGELNKISSYVPKDCYKLLTSSKLCNNEELFKIIKYKISIMSTKNLSEIFEVTEGLENKILSSSIISKSYDELVKNIKSKRYTETKIKRILLNILLDITKEDFNISYNGLNYAHVLAIGNNGHKLLSEISKNSDVNLLCSINDTVIQNLDEINRNNILLDIKASNIHSIIANSCQNSDYTNKL